MRKGFTLVELAIVLIIAGIIMGAAIKTTEIINSAKAKKNVTEITKLADAQHQFYERTGRYAGDSDNNGVIDHTTVNSDTYPDNTSDDNLDVDYPFDELEKLDILPAMANRTHASLTVGGPMYFSGNASTGFNMLVVRQVPCLTAFQMEISIDKSQPDDSGSAGTGRVRGLNGSTVLTGSTDTWTSVSAFLCGTDEKKLTNLIYLFDRF